MALPYNPVSPPPTAGPLPIIERANLGLPYSGGGGGGPSTIVSSFATASVSSLSVSSINGAAPGATISTFSIASISSLNVSSINGAAPGGSVPGDLAVSTLALGIPGGITGVSTISGTNNVLKVTGLLSVSSITGVGAPLSLDGQGQVINIAATAVNIGAAPVNISSATISSINNSKLPINFLTLNNTTTIGTGPSISVSNSAVTQIGGLQVVQFDVTTSTIYSGGGDGYLSIPANETTPGNWFWASNQTPCVIVTPIVNGSVAPISASSQLTGDPGNASQTQNINLRFSDSVNIPSTIRMTIQGVPYP